jgi:hypothetical protein
LQRKTLSLRKGIDTMDDHKPVKDFSRNKLNLSERKEIRADIWCEVLELKEVGIHDNFFELGGHSLMATRLVSRVRQIFNEDFTLRVVFDDLMVARQARFLESLNHFGNQEMIEL